MVTNDIVLAPPPSDPGARELWIQHVAGLIIFEDVRSYAAGRLDPNLDGPSRTTALQAIDDAVYGLMMVVDGVTGAVRGDDIAVELSLVARVVEAGTVTQRLDLGDGDGFCMGFHRWRVGDFGEWPLTAQPPGGE